jgi:secreted trypsin-like serine protease
MNESPLHHHLPLRTALLALLAGSMILAGCGQSMDAITDDDAVMESSDSIVGGTEARPDYYPWMASVQVGSSTSTTRHVCGASFIDAQWLVTAAHCLGVCDKTTCVPWSTSVLRIRAGSHYSNSGGALLTVAQLFPHPGFDPGTIDNDIGLIKLTSPVQPPPGAYPIDLPKYGEMPLSGTMGTVVGWGAMSEEPMILPDALLRLEAPIISDSTCQRFYGTSAPVNLSHMFCAGYPEGGKDPCWGDSGGPFFLGDPAWEEPSDGHELLLGIVSWGEGCARSRKPGVYTRVSSYVNWINGTRAGNP